MIGRIIFFVIFGSHLVLFVPETHAGNFGFGAHSGYGSIRYDEQGTASGSEIEAESTQDSFIFGVSGEYSFTRPENFYAGITTDWLFGLKDRETWSENGSKFISNDIRFFGQFYDFRFGYKNSLDNFYYRVYISGGWDGLHFKRDKFVWRGTFIEANSEEDISLWRIGGGAGLGYKIDKWALDSRFAYAYFPVADVDNNSLSRTFNTNGTCLDMGLGIARQITDNMSFYTGVSYTLLKLDQSEIMRGGSIRAVFPESRAEIILGVINLTYAF